MGHEHLARGLISEKGDQRHLRTQSIHFVGGAYTNHAADGEGVCGRIEDRFGRQDTAVSF